MEAIIRIAEALDIPASVLFERETDDADSAQDSCIKKAFRNSVHFIIITDPAGKILQVNQSALEFSGYSRESLVGNSILDITLWKNYDSDSVWIEQGLQEAEGGNSYWNELTVTDNDSNEHELAVAISPVQISDVDHSNIDLVIVEGYIEPE